MASTGSECSLDQHWNETQAAALLCTPPDPGVDENATIMPTNISALDPADFTGNYAQSLAGWISPSGHYYKVLVLAGHSELSEMLTGNLFGSAILERTGWVHLCMTGSPDLAPRYRLTGAQVATLTDLCQLCEGTEFSDELMAGITRHS